jgi:circadian clock protein KaiB
LKNKFVAMINKISKKKKIKADPECAGEEKYILRLFITGILPNSARAVKNINSICDQYLNGRYELEIIDIYQQPSLAVQEEIIAVPVLIKKFPLPEERMIGDLSNTEEVLKGLCLV